MRIGFISFLFIFIFCKTDYANNFTDSSKYRDDLKKAIIRLSEGKNLNTQKLVALTPSDSLEFFIYYSMTYLHNPKSFADAFYKLDEDIYKAAKRNDVILKRLLLISRYVDGEYADNYFDKLEGIMEHDKEKFCRLYSEQTKLTPLPRLKGYVAKNCNH